MKSNIKYRLFLSFLSAAFLAVICMFLAVQWSIDHGLFRYVKLLEHARFESLAGKLEKAYSEKGSWDFLRNKPDNWLGILASTLPEDDEVAPVSQLRPAKRSGKELGEGESTLKGTPLAKFARHFEKRIVLMDAGRNPIFGSLSDLEGIEYKTLFHSGQAVGYLGLQPPKHLSDIRQLSFVKQQKQALALAGVAVLLVVAGFSLPLANRLVRPVRAMAAASHRMAAGEFSVRVPIASSDELGQLAGDFNVLALALEKNEQARRQWVADISHELRTPLTVLRAVTEALQDGIRNPTPEAIRSIHGEVLRLSRLVDDLYQLSLSDLGALTYRKEDLDLAGVLARTTELYRAEFARKGINMAIDLPDAAQVKLFADPGRIQQLFANLLDNALKYTDECGELIVRMGCSGSQIVIDFMDSAPGAPEGELPKLFDRLYRLDGSRSRSTGGAGLGLAICRNIVEAHAGNISAQPSPLGGVWIRVALPLNGRC